MSLQERKRKSGRENSKLTKSVRKRRSINKRMKVI